MRSESCYEDGVNCSNGRDDDADGLVDCDDPDCAPVAEGGALDGPLPITVTGSVSGRGNDYLLGPELCRESAVSEAEDVTYTFTAPATGTYRFSSYITGREPFRDGVVMTIARPVCGAPDIACQAYDVPPGVDVPLSDGETVLVVIDPVFPTFLTYSLTIEQR